MFSAGISNSFSVYTLLFFFNVARFPALFCGFGGGPLLFGFFDFETPSFWGFELVLLFLIPDLLVACLDFTVEVREGAIVNLCDEMDGERPCQCILFCVGDKRYGFFFGRGGARYCKLTRVVTRLRYVIYFFQVHPF
jgi:hypothetical protein